MILYIVRHAWAGVHGDPRYPNDELRPLSEEGRKRFARVAKKLHKRGFEPDVIATSPLTRCLQTAEILAEKSVPAGGIVERDELRPGSDFESLLAWTAQQTVESAAWVGHAPDVGLLAARLLGDGGAAIRFSKAAVAEIRFSQLPTPGRGELQWLATAKLLGC